MSTKRKRRRFTGNGDLRGKVRKFFENPWAWVSPEDSLRRLGDATPGVSGTQIWEAFGLEFPDHHRELVAESERRGMLIPVVKPQPRTASKAKVIRQPRVCLDADQGGPDATA